tara:strand:+ start:693 stop:929 length:237 start_codon:yes stop_codon:yes gene_type:complete
VEQRSEIEWEELLWDIKRRIKRTKAIIEGVIDTPKEIVKNQQPLPTAAKLISMLESQEPMTAEKIRERSEKLRKKVFG